MFIGFQLQGFIIQKRDQRPTASGGTEDFFTNQEFHPMLYKQHESLPFQEMASFNQAVDEFFSKMESQKLDMKAVQQVDTNIETRLLVTSSIPNANHCT